MSVFTSQDEHRIEIDLNAASNSSTTGGAEGARTTTATPPASDPNDLEAQQAPTGATGVFARGVAAAYAVYTNVRKRVAKRFKDRVMRFMRYELSNSRPTTNAPSTRENAQGRPVRAADVTYDSLVFKITFVLGFLLRFPIMWMVGSFLFIGTANFKKSTIKWGWFNIILSTISILYFVQRALFLGTSVSVGLDRNFLFDPANTRQPWESSIMEGSESLKLKEFRATDALQWVVPSRTMPSGKFESVVLSANGNLVDPGSIKSYRSLYVSQGVEVVLRSWVQFGAVFTNASPTERGVQLMRRGMSEKLPVVYNPHDKPAFDVGLRCLSPDGKVVWIGVDASKPNAREVQSTSFYLQGSHKCSPMYTTSGSRPVVHSAYIKVL